MLRPTDPQLECESCGKTLLSDYEGRRYCSRSCAKKKPVMTRLMKRLIVNSRTGCWEWIGSLDGCGYGRIGEGTKIYSVHRLTYQFFHADEDINDVYVCHHCDNPSCANPEHLFTGTQLDNMRDMEAKGRGNQPRGERNTNAKLRESDVKQIRLLLRNDLSRNEVARRFGVTKTSIRMIDIGATWRHV